jgi:hypothetical protein
MTKIEIDGFLSNEADEGRNLVINSYREAFVLSKDLNRQAMSLFREYNLCMNNEVKVAIAALMTRIVETYQGIILMLERGMTSQARMLVRSQLEALFQMTAMVRNPNLYHSYAAKHYRSTISALKSAKRWKQESLQGRLSKEKIDELILDNEKKLEGIKAGTLKIYEWAEKAGLSDFYNVLYIENSSAIHSDMWALDDHVSDSEHGLQVNFGPNDFDLYHILRTSISIIISAIESFSIAQGIKIAEAINDFRNKALELDEKFYENDDENTNA